MTNQIVIDFPELDYETYSKVLKILDGIEVKLYVDETKSKIPLKWGGNRLCCPITMWWDIPDNIHLKGDREDHLTEDKEDG